MSSNRRPVKLSDYEPARLDYLDKYTPTAKRHFAKLSSTERRVLAHMCRTGPEVKYTPLAAACRIDPRVLGVMLQRLSRKQVVRRIARGRWKVANMDLYDWYQVRNASRWEEPTP